MNDTIAILDYGSQYSQLIARRLREIHVYCELLPWDAPVQEIMALDPKGFILSGGPNSVYDPGAPGLPGEILAAHRPILGICYGMQLLAHQLGGQVAAAGQHEYGLAHICVEADNPLLPPGEHAVWMSHGDRIDRLPSGFVPLASSPGSPLAAMASSEQGLFGLQFHPEVVHTPIGGEVLESFAVGICGVQPTWTADSIIRQSIEAVRAQVGDSRALVAVSGGVDSSVAALLVHRAIGSQLYAVFVDNGLLRQGERETVEAALLPQMGSSLGVIDASQRFLSELKGLTDPEQKRMAVGETFIRVFEAHARTLGDIPFLVQGTIYPDVVESRAPERATARRIKTHHNVGGLPENHSFKLVEPLRYLFKDEVRAIGEALGMPADLVWRQPFPGPGLSVRCLGEVTSERLERLRMADDIFTSALEEAGLLGKREAASSGIAQAFAALLPVQSVGVMGDQRTYQETIVLRAVTSRDFMTADWARLPDNLLAAVSSRIVNEVPGVNRVVYDLTSKPPATIEWE
jgi:GMP synthase (glutamine-hydrolysing)